jgi:uncharacterized protein YodC (DUF2158 family)
MVQLKVLLWKWGVIGPKPKFKIGDSVQLIGNDHLLVIQKIDLNIRERSLVYTCQWFDQETKTSRTNIFEEHQLKLYDWFSYFLLGDEKWGGDGGGF